VYMYTAAAIKEAQHASAISYASAFSKFIMG